MLKLVLIGNVGGEPDVRYSQSGTPYMRFNVAANTRRRSPEGEWVEHAEWVRVTVAGDRVEKLSQYIHKGTRVYVEGRLEARPWKTDAGDPMAGLEMMANEIEFMSARSSGEQGQRRDARPQSPESLEDLPF